MQDKDKNLDKRGRGGDLNGSIHQISIFGMIMALFMFLPVEFESNLLSVNMQVFVWINYRWLVYLFG